MNHQQSLETLEVLQVLAETRAAGQVVITNQGSAREWPKLTSHELDFHFLPSAMGAAIPFGLGLALGQPDREIMVISGDGSLLMNLGCLVTVTGSQAKNLTIIVLDNRSYAVTGVQKTAAHSGQVDYVALAFACGFESAQQIDELAQLRDWAAHTTPGPRFLSITVAPEHHQLTTTLPPIVERIQKLGDSLRHHS
jgi:thiamine pyrophosphate-dependent acetolactate synthase large subunit-like protein